MGNKESQVRTIFYLGNDFRQRTHRIWMGELKRLTPAPRTTHWPPLHGLPYGLLHGLPYGLPLRTTLNNQPNSFYGVEKYKTPTCSNYTIITAWKTDAISFSETAAIFSTPSFSFSPHSSPGHLPQRCFHNERSVSAVEYLSFSICRWSVYFKDLYFSRWKEDSKELLFSKC